MSSCLIHFAMLLLSDSLCNVVSWALLSCSSLRSNALTNLRFFVEWRFFASSWVMILRFFMSDDSSFLHEIISSHEWQSSCFHIELFFLSVDDSLAALSSSYSLLPMSDSLAAFSLRYSLSSRFSMKSHWLSILSLPPFSAVRETKIYWL